jgi:hypothetical protein
MIYQGSTIRMTRTVFACVSTALLAGLCQCSLLFSLSALDQNGNLGSDGGDAQPSLDTDADAQSAPDTDEDAPDNVGIEAVDETSAADVTPGGSDSSPDVTDRVAPGSDAGDASIEADTGVDASHDASPDVLRDASVDVAPPFDASTCPSVVLTPMPTAVASTSRGTNYANQAIDMNFTTRWESMQQDDEPDGGVLPPQWIYIDFGVPVFITQVQILWQDACAQSYDLQVSDDAMAWTTMPGGSIIGNSQSTLGAPTSWSMAVATTGLSGVGRYLRVYATQRCQPPYGYSIWEMRALGHGAAGCAQGM